MICKLPKPCSVAIFRLCHQDMKQARRRFTRTIYIFGGLRQNQSPYVHSVSFYFGILGTCRRSPKLTIYRVGADRRQLKRDRRK